VTLSFQVAELEAENARLAEQCAQWMMHHAHAATSVQRVREALLSGNTDPTELLAIINEQNATSGTDRFVDSFVGDLVREWTEKPIPEVSRAAVRDWLIAHKPGR
jgi:hypothetical protein